MPGLTRADLDSIPAHTSGSPIPGAIRLAANEVPYGPLPGVREAIDAVVCDVWRYPDWDGAPLRRALAQRYAVAAERIATGCGSVALAEHLVRAACVPGDEIVFPWPSFEAYPMIAATNGLVGTRVPNTGEHGHDLPAMAAAITPRTRLVLVCNPNNPTGTAVSRERLDEFLDAVPADVLVLIDEAYREFVTDHAVPDALDTYGERENVVVLRTLSKAWGLAGLRVGFLVAAPKVAEAVRKMVTPFSTNLLACEAALAALRAEDEMCRRVGLVIAERERVLTSVRKTVADVPDSQANFVWLPLGERAAEFGAMCGRAAVLVRTFPAEGVRVTIGTPEQNDALLAVAQHWQD